MQQFLVGQDGLMSEAAATEQAAWYASRCPNETDPLDFEAHITFARTYSLLSTEAPFGRRAGLTKARFNVLRMLYATEWKRMPMSEIAAGMGVSPANVTKLADSLEREDYVRRAADPATSAGSG